MPPVARRHASVKAGSAAHREAAAEHLADGVGAERRRAETAGAREQLDAIEQLAPLGVGVLARGDDEADPQAAEPMGEVGEEAQRGHVGPLGVIDEQQQRAPLRQLGHVPVQPVLDREAVRGDAARRQRRLPVLAQRARGQGGRAPQRQRGSRPALATAADEQLAHDAPFEAGFELGAAGLEHGQRARRAAAGGGAQQRRLADPGHAADDRHAAGPRDRVVHHVLDHRELARPFAERRLGVAGGRLHRIAPARRTLDLLLDEQGITRGLSVQVGQESPARRRRRPGSGEGLGLGLGQAAQRDVSELALAPGVGEQAGEPVVGRGLLVAERGEHERVGRPQRRAARGAASSASAGRPSAGRRGSATAGPARGAEPRTRPRRGRSGRPRRSRPAPARTRAARVAARGSSGQGVRNPSEARPRARAHRCWRRGGPSASTNGW